MTRLDLPTIPDLQDAPQLAVLALLDAALAVVEHALYVEHPIEDPTHRLTPKIRTSSSLQDSSSRAASSSAPYSPGTVPPSCARKTWATSTRPSDLIVALDPLW